MIVLAFIALAAFGVVWLRRQIRKLDAELAADVARIDELRARRDLRVVRTVEAEPVVIDIRTRRPVA